MKTLPPIDQLRGRTLGRVLIKMGVLTREKVHECLKVQKTRKGAKLGELLIELGLIDHEQLQIALAAQQGLEYIGIDGIDIPDGVLDKVPAQTAKNYHAVPISYNENENELTVVLDSAENFRVVDDLTTLLGFKVVAKITDGPSVEAALKK